MVNIQREEEKVKRSVKDAAKKGQKDVCVVLAKEMIRSRKAVSKLYASKAHMNSVLMGMKNQLGPTEKQKEEEREQGGQDQREPSSSDGWRCRRRPTLEHRTEPPKVQRRSRRRKNMKKEIRTARGAITH
ncbi:hypothetical protein U0070_017192 [Myodes glareolus]|uniref:Uncharacterized protein n=1 Tax=Myodes glareolus TaxID=447135 RepID=A0AAW0HX49_MYOGA